MRVIALDSQGSWMAEAALLVEKGSSGRCHLQKIERLRLARDEEFSTHPVLCEGFYDSHSHPAWSARLRRQVDARGKSAQDVFAEISASSSHPVFGFGWDEKSLGLSAEEWAKKLDAVDKKIVFSRICGHMAFVSGLGLIRDGELDKIPRMSLNSSDLYEVFREWAQWGILGPFNNLLLHPEDLASFHDSAPETMQFADVSVIDSFTADNKAIPYAKFFLDGSLGARTAWLRDTYADENVKGRQLWSEHELEQAIRKCLARGYRLAFHAIGDAALDQLLKVADKLSEELRASSGAPYFHRIEHLQVCRDDQIETLQRQGFWSLGLQPSHRIADLGFAESRLGKDRLKRDAYRLGSFLRAGLRVSLGSDAPIVSPDPRLNFEAIASDARETERISIAEIYRLYCVLGRQNAGISAKSLAANSTAWLSTLHL